MAEEAKQFRMFVGTNAKSVLTEVSKTLRIEMKKYLNEYARTVAEIFVEDAKKRLKASGYNNSEKLAENIFFQRSVGYGNYRIGIKGDNETKEVMFYLEFGTGFVGRDNPHDMASEVGWEYAINENAVDSQGKPIYFDLTKPKGQQGLNSFYAPTPDPKKGMKGWIYKDKETGALVATSGLKAVSYIWDTFKDIENIKKKAKERMNNGKQPVPRRRIVRK